MKAMRYVLWLGMFVFIGYALVSPRPARLPDPGIITPGLQVLKFVAWAVFGLFVGYTLYCSWHENMFLSIRKMAALHWGRQVGIDLYIGLLLFLIFVYFNEQSMAMVLVWLLPTILYGNIIPLLYFASRFDSIVAAFL